MKAVFALISRNRKLFFKDRGMFFSALITPGILILLYATFLANVYRDSFVSAIPDMITISDKLIAGTLWKHVVKHRQFSTDNPGSVIRSGNDRKCRVWIFMRSLHADFKFRQRPAESTVVSAKYLRNFSAEKSYAPWNLRRDGEQSAARRNDYCDS